MRIVPLTLREANDFVERHHRHSASDAAPKGAPSKLYARARRIWQLMGGVKWLTYTLQREGGASLRGAGVKQPAAAIPGRRGRRNGRQWNCKSRPREQRDIYDEPKFRWDETLPEVPA